MVGANDLDYFSKPCLFSLHTSIDGKYFFIRNVRPKHSFRVLLFLLLILVRRRAELFTQNILILNQRSLTKLKQHWQQMILLLKILIRDLPRPAPPPPPMLFLVKKKPFLEFPRAAILSFLDNVMACLKAFQF